MPTVNINLESRKNSYQIVIENGIFKKIPAILSKKKCGDAYAIICDRKIAKLYGYRLQKEFKKKNIQSLLVIFPEGEKAKNFKTIEKIIQRLSIKKINRHDCIIALGGGVTGDIAGFIASIYMRGIGYIQIPTTLLAMIDSSIGGKTGINLTSVKNLIGTFYQPSTIYVDPKLLKSCKKREILNGFAEIIKYAIIKKNSLLKFLEDHTQEIKNLDMSILYKIIMQCIKIKAAFIEKDEFDLQERKQLNYGHTIGHALEINSAFNLNHGEATLLGILIINQIAKKLNLIDSKFELRINNLINNLEMLNFWRQKKSKLAKIIKPAIIWKIMQKDKKMLKSKIYFIIAKKHGQVLSHGDINKITFIKYFPNL